MFALIAMLPATATADRIVSAYGALTEILYELAAADQLVGVDVTSQYPQAARELPNVGYYRQLPFEGILALEPDRVLVTTAAEPKRTLERLEQAGVQVDRFPSMTEPQDLIERVLRLGELLDRSEQARALAGRLEEALDAILAQAESRPHRPRVAFVFAPGEGLMLMGRGTFAESLTQTLQAENAVPNVQGFQPVSRESLLAADPDFLVIVETQAGAFDERDWPELRALEAWQQGAVVRENAQQLLGGGPRLPRSLARLNEALSALEPAND